jgi:hypothetical protein
MNSSCENDVAKALLALQLQRLPSPSPSPPPMDKKRKLPPQIDTDLQAETPRLARRRLSEFDAVSLDTKRHQPSLKTMPDGSLQVVQNQVPNVDAVRRYLELQERKLNKAKLEQAKRSRLPSPTSPVEEQLVVPAENIAMRKVQATMHFGSGSKLSAVPRRIHQQVKSELKKRPSRTYNLERDPEVAELTAKLGINGARVLSDSRETLKKWMYQRATFGGPQQLLIRSKFSQMTL